MAMFGAAMLAAVAVAALVIVVVAGAVVAMEAVSERTSRTARRQIVERP